MFKILSTCKCARYVFCRTEPKHPLENSKGLYPLHRVLIENKLGRLLNYDEVVHHKNGIKDDNNIENLELLLRGQHTKNHKIVDEIKCVCPVCDKVFYQKPNNYRLRLKRSKSGKIFCSVRCGAINQNRK